MIRRVLPETWILLTIVLFDVFVTSVLINAGVAAEGNIFVTYLDLDLNSFIAFKLGFALIGLGAIELILQKGKCARTKNVRMIMRAGIFIYLAILSGAFVKFLLDYLTWLQAIQ
jgi:hypothetical protein